MQTSYGLCGNTMVSSLISSQAFITIGTLLSLAFSVCIPSCILLFQYSTKIPHRDALFAALWAFSLRPPNALNSSINH